MPETRSFAAMPVEGWHVQDDGDAGSPDRNVTRDRLLGERVAAAGGPPTYRVWTNRRCIVVTRREARLPTFPQAVRASGEEGWPVVVRDSGGTAIPHLPETLQFTLALPRGPGHEPSIEAVYRALGTPVQQALARLGVDASFGEVPRSFCDGRFNLVVDGRKVAGSAQRWTGGVPGSGGRGGFILAHLSLFVAGDMAGATEAVNRFLRRAGGPGGFDPEAVASLSDLSALLPRNSALARARTALLEAVAPDSGG